MKPPRDVARAVSFVAGCAWLLIAAGRPAMGIPAAAKPVLAAVARAANDHQPQAAARYAAPGRTNVLPWAGEESMMSAVMQPEPWKAAWLDPPFTNHPGSLAVFHTWHSPESDGDHIHPLVRTAAGWRLDREIPETDTQGYHVTHHQIHIRIVPEKHLAVIKDTFSVRRSPGAKPVAFLRLSNDFRVSGVRAGSRSVPYRQAGGIVAVSMPAGQAVSLTMEYSGQVNHAFFSSIKPEQAVMNAYYWPHFGRLPATAETTLVVPKGWTAITQGHLIQRTERSGEVVFRYKNELPVNYLSLAAGPYVERTRRFGRLTLYTYFLKDNPELSDRMLDAVEMSLPYFERRFSPYPYNRYSIVDGGPVMGGVALEGYSFATYGAMTLVPFVVSHEVSHTWWGGIVPNTYLRSWWNESFASYSDDQLSRLRNKVTTLHPSDKPWWPQGQAVWAAPLSTARHDVNVDTIAYRKGWVVLTLLQEQVGTEAFDRCVQEFIRASRSTLDPGWPDFRRAVEKVTGRDWGWFFAQWVNLPGWPRLNLTDARFEADGQGGYTVTARIKQDTRGIYRLRVPLHVAGGEEGATTTVFVTSASTPVKITVRFRPERLILDPEFTIPRDMGEDGVKPGDIEFDENGKGRAVVGPRWLSGTAARISSTQE